MSSIIWLTKQRGLSDKERWKCESMLKTYARITPAQVRYLSIHARVKDMWTRKGTKSWKWNEAKKPEVHAALRHYISLFKPKLIVVNDAATVGFIAGLTSLELTRGSVYFFDGVPIIVVDELFKDFTVKHYTWVLINDIEKIGRWFYDRQRQEPKFQYTIVRSSTDISQAVQFLLACSFIAYDIETRGTLITCLSYTGLHKDGRVYTYIFPFIDPRKADGCYWATEELEIYAWQAVGEIGKSTGPIKIAQNGNYDNAYFVLLGLPVFNYLLDTQALFHAIWTEAPKKLNFIASICLDYMRYWKDELKGAKQEAIAKTDEGFNRYLRYNGLDTHYTLLSALYLLRNITSLPWAMANYDTEFSLQIGPFFAGGMTGFKLNKQRQAIRTLEFSNEYQKHLAQLRCMVDLPEFNPGAPAQVAELFYDVLGAPVPRRSKKIKNPRSTDKSWLKILGETDAFLRIFTDKIKAVKEPANNLSKYGTGGWKKNGKRYGLHSWNGRFVYSLHAQGTETGRGASSKHYFWIGTNAQNMPYDIRDMLVADEGYVIADFDYSQSDAVFIAHESQDENYIRTMTSGKDTHLIHCAHFFKRDFDSLLAAKKANEDWLMKEPTGIRPITKRIVHGSNFRMRAFTLYMTMGREAVISAAINLGATCKRIVMGGNYFEYIHIPGFIEQPPGIVGGDYKITRDLPPKQWGQNECVILCEIFLNDFHQLYPGLQPWFTEIVNEAIKNGNIAACAGGRSRVFFGDIAKDEAIQRELTAYYGQGGTAWNINRSLLELYYKSQVLHDNGAIFITQTHDSLTFLFPIERLHTCAKEVLTVMQKPFTIKGREVVVKAESKMGLSWGKGLIEYKPDLPMDKLIFEHEKNVVKKRYADLKTKLNIVEVNSEDLPDDVDEDESEIEIDEMELEE